MLAFYMSLISDEDDRKKLEDIYNKYHELIFKITYKITEHQYYAEAATSNTVLVLVNNIKRIRTENEHELKAFIITIAKNEAISVLKEKSEDNNFFSEIKETNLSYRRNIENDLMREEERIKILNAINAIPLSYRLVLTLKYANNLSASQISKILKMKSGTVRVQIKRGKEMLRKILADAEMDDEN